MVHHTLSTLSLETIGPWLILIGFGAYHGLNPGMGWLFALSLGLQQRSERAIWLSLIPIVLGHTVSLIAVALVVLAGAHLLSTTALQWLTAILLVGFGLYKVVRYYRHPRWVGMRVNMRDLTWWSFLMATAHGAGLMIAPVLMGLTQHAHHDHHMSLASAGSLGMGMGITVHTLAMMAVMAAVAWIVYKRLGLSVLRRSWVNFDLIWAVALLVVGGVALGNVALAA